MARPIPSTEPRDPERLRAHYLVERELASRLRESTFEERSELYSALYDELFERIADHPQRTRSTVEADPVRRVAKQVQLLAPHLGGDVVFAEIGAGDATLSIQVAPKVLRAYAVDVSQIVFSSDEVPKNLHRVLTDGVDVPVPEPVDVMFSNQLMEHLHPDDAVAQLRSIHDRLRDNGTYLCITPNRITGPHDISRYFDDVATGFHLKEYTLSELAGLMASVGFSDVRWTSVVRGRAVTVPIRPLIWFEALVRRLPDRVHGLKPVRMLLNVSVVAIK